MGQFHADQYTNDLRRDLISHQMYKRHSLCSSASVEQIESDMGTVAV